MGNLLQEVEDPESLKGPFRRSRAFNNLWFRADRLAPDRVWLKQASYRPWAADDWVTFNGRPVLRAPRIASRLLWIDPTSGPIASIVLHHKPRRYGEPAASHVGRTLIVAPHRWVHSGTDAHLLAADYRVLIPELGEDVVIRTFPFAEQDPDHHRCIDVSLWLALDYLSKLMNTPRVPLGMMRSAAFRARNHMVPAPGLHSDDVVDAIATAGLAPLQIHIQRPRRRTGARLLGVPIPGGDWVSSLISRYSRPQVFREFMETVGTALASQLPVVLVTARFPRVRANRDVMPHTIDPGGMPVAHSLCVVGFDAPAAIEPPSPVDDAHRNFSTLVSRITRLIVHDDQIGPFLGMHVHARPVDSWDHLEREGSFDELWWETLEQSAVSAYLALPPEVRLPSDVVYGAVNGLLMHPGYRQFFDDEAARTEDADLGPHLERLSALWQALDENDEESADTSRVLVHVYLEHTSRFRLRVARSPHLPPAVREAYLDAILPKYLWIAEIGMTADYTESGAAWVLGEILLDPTHDIRPDSIMAVRLPGLMLGWNPEGDGAPSMLASPASPRPSWSHLNFIEGRGPAEE